jgi:hypothetical protein
VLQSADGEAATSPCLSTPQYDRLIWLLRSACTRSLRGEHQGWLAKEIWDWINAVFEGAVGSLRGSGSRVEW